MENKIETEQDLQALIGQFESIRLDFKASALLDQPKDRIIKQLTEDVSSFANTEGGVIVIGIREGKSGKKSVAIEIDDGSDPAKVSPDWLEQLIASNISPPIGGLTVRPIPLSGPRAGRIAYVITVPKGITAYQARHSLLYYGRTEFAAAPLHDNIIRLLMTRGRVPQARVEITNFEVLTADQEWSTRQTEHQEIQERRNADEIVIYGRGVPPLEYFEAPKRDYNQSSFRLLVVNTGEVTIRDFLLSVAFTTDFKLYHVTSPRNFQSEVTPGTMLRFRLSQGLEKTTFAGKEHSPPDQKIFPNDRLLFPNHEWHIHVPVGAPIYKSTILLHWTIYLDDAPPSSGEIDLTEHFEKSDTGKISPASRAPK
jgi:Schlafen, AlbA_2